MIVKNELGNLKQLGHLFSWPEINWCIVDTGSTDGTQKYLKDTCVDLKESTWQDDFSKARNESLCLATSPWVLWLDADDRIDFDVLKSLINNLDRFNDKTAFSLTIHNPLPSGQNESFKQIRLFPNHKGIEFRGCIHEELGRSLQEKKISIQSLPLEIHHLGYENSINREKKIERNHVLLKKAIGDHPEDPFVLMEMGNSYFQKKEYQLSIGMYEKAIEYRGAELGSALDGLEMLIGNSYKQFDDSKSYPYFEKSILRNPHIQSPYFLLGKQKFLSKEFNEAKQYFSQLFHQGVRVGVLAESNEALYQNSCAYLAIISFEERSYAQVLFYMEKSWANSKSLAIDPWVILESCYFLSKKKEGMKWQKRLQLKALSSEHKKIQKWLLTKNIVLNRESWNEAISHVIASPNDKECWEQLKVVTTYLDNESRTIDTLLQRSSLSEKVIKMELNNE